MKHYEIKQVEYADVSTQHVTPADQRLLLDEAFPFRFGEIDGGAGHFLFVPTGGKEFAERLGKVAGLGASGHLLYLLSLLFAREVQYVRLSSDGYEVKGLPGVSQEEKGGDG